MRLNRPQPRAHTPGAPLSRKVLAGLTALAVAATGLAAAAPANAAAQTITGSQAVGLVNTFIGSLDDGNTFPGATTPFGMVQLSPDNGHNVGYYSTNDAVRGFSQVHLSGVGCGLGGFVPVLPTTDSPTGSGFNSDYASGNYSRSVLNKGQEGAEVASPGYYKTVLSSGAANNITAELTATTRTGVQKYSFSSGDDVKSYVRINAGQALSSVRSSKVTIDAANRTVATETTVYGFCQDTPDFTVYSISKFNQAFQGYGTWTGNTYTANKTSASSTDRTGASLEFARNATVEVQTAISYVSAAGAQANLTAESNTFNGARTAANAAWADQLGKVSVTQSDANAQGTDKQTQLKTFYSALYRSFVAPNVGSDVDGKYRGWDTQIHQVSDDGLGAYYQDFSLWDTYRTQQQWLYLTEPKKSADMAKSIVLQAEQSGWTPRWGYGPVETNVMTGDPATPFLVSAWDQGLLTGTWEERTYAVLKHNADNQPAADVYVNGRADNDRYIARGYVTQNKKAKFRNTDYDMDHGGSATLEYALADGTLAYMAKKLGHTADAERYALRGQNFRSEWDPATKTFRARDKNGIYLTKGTDEEKSAFHEGTSAQYEWLVSQDVPSLISLMGGKQATNDRLDTFFAYNSIDLESNPGRVAKNSGSNTAWWVTGTYDYYGTKTYNPNNEPDLNSAYTYLWTGQPWKTTDIVREALTLFTDTPNGVTGNDDLGTMAAWQVMSTIGIYPIIPGKDVWGLTTPVFDKVEIALDKDVFGKDELTISADGASMTNRYTQSVAIGTQQLDRAYLSGTELTSAGTLSYTVGSSHSQWATSDEASPGSLATVTDLPTRLVVQPTTSVYERASQSRAIVSAGSSTAVPVSLQFTGTKAVAGDVTVTAPAGLTASVTQGATVSVNPQGGTVMANATVQISADASVTAGTYNVAVSVGSGSDAVASSLAVSVATTEQTLLGTAGALNNQAIASSTNSADSANAKFNKYESDGRDISGQEFFLRDQATAAGFPLGVYSTYPGDASMSFRITNAVAQNDNLIALGQTTNVAGKLPNATKIAFVVAGNNGNASGNVTLNFKDGTSKSESISATDWCSDWSSQAGNNVPLGRATQRYSSGVQDLSCGIAVTQVISLGGKELTSITWPTAKNMHVFAIASDAAAVASAAPAITGGTSVGTQLQGAVPDFGSAATVSKQWLRDGVPIAGATGDTYTVSSADEGTTITFQVTAVVAGINPTTVTSQPFAILAPTEPVIITATQQPTVTGTAQVGKTLTANPGEYEPADAAVSLQWLADGVAIPGATSPTLLLDEALLGKSISVRATVTRQDAETKQFTSAATSAVSAADDNGGGDGGGDNGGGAGTKDPITLNVTAFVNGVPATASSILQIGQSLTVNPGASGIQGTSVAVTYQWYAGGKAIAGAVGPSYAPEPADAKKAITVRITAAGDGYKTVTALIPFGTVKLGTIRGVGKTSLKVGSKKVTKKTKIRVGKRIKARASKATAPGSPVKVSYKWYAGKKAIKGKAGKKATLKVTKKLAGKRLKVKVTYSAAGYASKSSTSIKTSKVK
ncbi:GH92 family glycosyl hydrolase, partial [Rarobacter incanus]